MTQTKSWKDRLYDSYVSSGQSSADHSAEDLFGQRGHVYNKIIRKHFPKNSSSTILDLGCGHGSFLYFIKRSGYNNCKGIDLSTEEVELAHKLGLTEVSQGDLFSYLESKTEQSDVILLMDILEHLEKKEVIDTLDNINSCLSSKGRLIIHIPNAEGIFGMRIRYGDFTHESSFTPKSITQILNITGYTNIRIIEDKPVIHGVISLARRILWGILTVRYRLLLAAETGNLSFILSQNMLVVADKKS